MADGSACSGCHLLGCVALGRSLHLSDQTSQVTKRWSEVTPPVWHSARCLDSRHHVTCYLVSPLRPRPSGFSQRNCSQVGPLLTLNAGAKLVNRYLSLLKLLRCILFLSSGRELIGRERGGPVWVRRMGQLGRILLTPPPLPAPPHPVLSSRANSGPPQLAHLGADGRGRPDLLLPVALRLRAGAAGAAPPPPTHPESVSGPSLRAVARAPLYFLLPRRSVPVFFLEEREE